MFMIYRYHSFPDIQSVCGRAQEELVFHSSIGFRTLGQTQMRMLQTWDALICLSINLIFLSIDIICLDAFVYPEIGQTGM